jgi:hypothetical protein
VPYITAAGVPANIKTKIKPHLTAINFTLAGIPFPAVFDSGAQYSAVIPYSLTKVAHSERYPVFHSPFKKPTNDFRIMPIGVAGVDGLQVLGVVEYATDNSPSDNLIPLEFFTPKVSVHFKEGSISFLTKR